jgi:aldose 1-epimerase
VSVTNRITGESFGKLADGRDVAALTLRSTRGLEATVLTWGATLAALHVPDAAGRPANVVLGFDTLDGYLRSGAHIGGIVGRYANRIAHGRFTLDGVAYRIPANNGRHALHGGPQGFDRVLWQVEALEEGETPAVVLRYVSPNGDQGFPGRLDVHVRYTLEADGLRLDYTATTDRPTVVNLSSHAYFNLAGAGSGDVLDHELVIAADRFTPVDADLIPTGELRTVAGTPLDFRQPTRIGARIDAPEPQLLLADGYDHNFVLESAGDTPRLAVRVREPASGRLMEVWTTEPGVQFYSGNFLDGSDVGYGGRRYARRYGFCPETQHFPDSPNQPAFPSTVLRPGETFRSATMLRFSSP